MFKEYASLLEAQHKSPKTIKEINLVIEDLTKSVEHAYQVEDARKQRDKERLTSKNLDVDFGPYMVQLHRKINSNWVPLRGDVTAGRVIALFKVQSNGSIEGVKLVTPSSSETADEACLRAIKASNPLLPLPDGAPKSIDVQFTFDAIDK